MSESTINSRWPRASEPLILIVARSWAVFWIEPNDANTQMAVAITAMLTLVAYRFAVDSDVPKLP